eukprot:scaffold371.g5172.t1
MGASILPDCVANWVHEHLCHRDFEDDMRAVGRGEATFARFLKRKSSSGARRLADAVADGFAAVGPARPGVGVAPEGLGAHWASLAALRRAGCSLETCGLEQLLAHMRAAAHLLPLDALRPSWRPGATVTSPVAKAAGRLLAAVRGAQASLPAAESDASDATCAAACAVPDDEQQFDEDCRAIKVTNRCDSLAARRAAAHALMARHRTRHAAALMARHHTRHAAALRAAARQLAATLSEDVRDCLRATGASFSAEGLALVRRGPAAWHAASCGRSCVPAVEVC